MKNLKLPIFLFFAFWSTASFAIEIGSVSFFGLSTHNDNNEGKGYEELNYGFSMHFGKRALTDSMFLDYQIGAFRNSYDDFAYWGGAEVSYHFNKEIIAVVDIRHWRTKRNTYAKRTAVLYPKLRFRFTEKASFDWLIRKSGHIFSYRIDLK